MVMGRGIGARFEDFDDDHATTAGGTCGFVVLRLIASFASLGIGRRMVVLSRQEPSGQRDVVDPVAVGQQTVMADAVEAFGKDVDQEAPDELMDRQAHGLVAFCPFGSIVLPGEGDGVVVDTDQPSVGDGDPVGVAGEIGKHGFGPGEGLLGVDGKVGLVERLEVGVEGSFVDKRLVVVEKVETTVGMGLLEAFEDQATEQA